MNDFAGGIIFIMEDIKNIIDIKYVPSYNKNYNVKQVLVEKLVSQI